MSNSTFSTTATLNSPAGGRAKIAVSWLFQIGLAAMFLMAGSHKLAGDPMMVGLFEKIGIGQWFRYLTGTIEFGSAVLLLIPGFAGVGAALLVPTMLGAIATHLFIIGGNPALPTGLLVLAAAVLYIRKDQVLRFVR